MNDRALMGLLDQAREQEGAKQGVLASAAKLEERLLWMQRFFAHEAIKKVDAADAKEIQREITYNAVRPTRVAWIVLGARWCFRSSPGTGSGRCSTRSRSPGSWADLR